MPNKKPLLSIVIPVYNSDFYIQRCVNSVLESTFQDYELILIDDGSNQKTKSILKKIAQQSPKIKLIHQKNQGVAKTRNKGIQLATGQYIMFIDNDDYIGNHYLQTYVDAIKSSKSDIVIGGYQRITETKKVLHREELQQGIFSKFIVMAPWAKIYRTKFLMKNNITFLNYSIGEDVYFNMLTYMSTNRIRIIDNTDYCWFYNTQSVSNTSQKTFSKKIDPIFLLEKIISCSHYHSTPLIQYYFIRYCVWYLLFSGRNDNQNNFTTESTRIFTWLEKQLPDYTQNEYLHTMPSGENKKTYFIVKTVLYFWRHHKIRLFAKLYCKGIK